MTLKITEEKYGFVAGYIRYLVKFVASKGFSEEEILEGIGCSPEDLFNESDWFYLSDPKAFANHLINLTGNPNLGFEFGFSLSLKNHGYVGYAAGKAETLAEAHELLAKYFRALSTVFSLKVFKEGGEQVLQIEEQTALGDALVFWIQSLFASLISVSPEVLGEEFLEQMWDQCAIRVTFSPPVGIPEEFTSASSNISYDCAFNQLRMPLELMDRKLPGADAFVSKMAQEHCEEKLQSINPYQEGIVVKVRSFFLEQTSACYPNLEQVAAALNMSSRSLKRKLKNAGTSFQEILDSVRKGQAVDFLLHSSKTIEEISALLGFSDPSNFGRAFKRWTSLSPRAYRNNG